MLRREEKYKAKQFNDIVVHRGGDAVSAWLAVPPALLWAGLAYALGRRQEALAARPVEPGGRR